MFLTACTASVRYASNTPKPLPHSNSATTATTRNNILRNAAEQWLGVPYRYGGDDRNGIDCSALARRLYRKAFGIELPRQSNAQRLLGYAVHPPYLKPGDLIFFRFKGDERIEHVGVYLGQNQFVHASRSRGVVIDRLDDPYYRKHVVVIKRVLR